MKFKALLMAATFGALSACGGGGSGGLTFADYANLSAATDLNDLTPDATVNGASDTLNYSGFVNIGPDTGGSTLVGYIGNLDVAVDFGADTVDGSATNFGEWTAASPSGAVPAVSGSLDINGALTTVNDDSLGAGMNGTAVGTVDGYNFNMTFDGNVLGADRSGVVLYFDNIGDLGGGVGIAVR